MYLTLFLSSFSGEFCSLKKNIKMSANRNGCNVTDVGVQKYIANATFLLLSRNRKWITVGEIAGKS